MQSIEKFSFLFSCIENRNIIQVVKLFVLYKHHHHFIGSRLVLFTEIRWELSQTNYACITVATSVIVWKCTESKKQQLLQAWVFPLICSLDFQQSSLKDFVSAVMNTSTPTKTNKKTLFGLGYFLGSILFDLYARY